MPCAPASTGYDGPRSAPPSRAGDADRTSASRPWPYPRCSIRFGDALARGRPPDQGKRVDPAHATASACATAACHLLPIALWCGRRSALCGDFDSRRPFPSIPAIDEVTRVSAGHIGPLPQPVNNSHPVFIGGRTTAPRRHNAISFRQWQLATHSPNGKLARLDELDEPTQKGIITSIHGLTELNLNLEHEFLELPNTQLLALTTIQTSKTFGQMANGSTSVFPFSIQPQHGLHKQPIQHGKVSITRQGWKH